MSGSIDSGSWDPTNGGQTGGTPGGQPTAGLGDFINNLVNTYWTQPQIATGQAIGQGVSQMFGTQPPGQATPLPNAQAPQGGAGSPLLAALLQILGPALAQKQAGAAQQPRRVQQGGQPGGQVIQAGPPRQ